MIEGRHFQNAYITRDVDAAADRLLATTDIRQHVIIDSAIDVLTPQGTRRQNNRLGLFWAGDVQYEFIQPLDGDDYYGVPVPRDGSLLFHHTAMRVPDWTAFRARVETLPYPVVAEGRHEDLRFLYLDARALCGHHLEFMSVNDARWEQMGGRN